MAAQGNMLLAMGRTAVSVQDLFVVVLIVQAVMGTVLDLTCRLSSMVTLICCTKLFTRGTGFMTGHVSRRFARPCIGKRDSADVMESEWIR